MEIGRDHSLLQVLHPLEDADIRLHRFLLHLPRFLQLLQERILVLYLQVKQVICAERTQQLAHSLQDYLQTQKNW